MENKFIRKLGLFCWIYYYLIQKTINLGEKYDFSLLQTELKNRTHQILYEHYKPSLNDRIDITINN